MFNTIPMLYNTMPNLPAYMSLGNRYWTSNYGGEIQNNIYPSGYSPLVYALAQGFGSPNHISQWNPMLIGFNLGGNMMTDPALTAAGNQAAFNWGRSLALQSSLNITLNNLSGIENQIKSIIKSDKLDESQKQRLQAILDEISELKERMAEMTNGQISTEAIEAAKGEVLELIKKASDTAKEIIEEIQESQSSDNDDATDGTESDGNNENVSDNEGVSDNGKTGSSNTQIQDEAAGIVGLIFDAVDGAGTKNEQLASTVEQINKDNIVAVFDAWNENYKDTEGSLVKRIYDDEFWINGGNDYVKHMVDAFEEKARELGLYSKLIKEFTTVNSELTSFWNTDEAKVSDAMDKIHQTIKAAETEKVNNAKAAKDKTKAKAAAKKAENEKKTAEKAEQRKNQFRDDMREILGDDKAEVSEKVKYENNKFVIRIEGKNYYGKDYLELAKALEKAGYEPNKYLQKQKLAAVA